MKSIVQSDRLRPRAIQLLKSMAEAHLSDPNCPYAREGRAEECPKLIKMREDIATEERLLSESNYSRSFGLK